MNRFLTDNAKKYFSKSKKSEKVFNANQKNIILKITNKSGRQRTEKKLEYHQTSFCSFFNEFNFFKHYYTNK